MIPDDMPLVIFVGRVFLVLAAIATTSFPVLYAFSAWEKSLLGRSTMAQSVALALAVNLKLVLTFFLNPENRPYLLWVNVGILVAITVTSAWLTYTLLTIRRKARERSRHAALEQDV